MLSEYRSMPYAPWTTRGHSSMDGRKMDSAFAWEDDPNLFSAMEWSCQPWKLSIARGRDLHRHVSCRHWTRAWHDESSIVASDEERQYIHLPGVHTTDIWPNRTLALARCRLTPSASSVKWGSCTVRHDHFLSDWLVIHKSGKLWTFWRRATWKMESDIYTPYHLHLSCPQVRTESTSCTGSRDGNTYTNKDVRRDLCLERRKSMFCMGTSCRRKRETTL